MYIIYLIILYMYIIYSIIAEEHHYNHECKRSTYANIVKRYASQYEQIYFMTDPITGNQVSQYVFIYNY